MTENDNEQDKLDAVQIGAFLGYNAMIGMKYALAVIAIAGLSAIFIERLTLLMFKLGGK